MNYRHIYHAGIFADVFKHVLLIAIVQSLLQKDKPFCYLDTHAGIGKYDLFSTEAQKTLEAENGIIQLINHQYEPVPALIRSYLAIVNYYNSKEKLRFYPGSPGIVSRLIRKQDRMLLSELHPEDCQSLKNEFYNDCQIKVHHMDGYLALKALLPPIERRGLVLIDPAFENPEEYTEIYQGINNALSRWQLGIYAIWYPLTQERQKKEAFIHQLKAINANKILVTEFSIYPANSPLGLNGCGMAVINPPWLLDNKLNELLPWLWRVLSPSKWGGYKVEWLKYED